jgi:uncharacterized iron-regulated membrane protein
MFGRRIWVVAHRWAGLTLALFLTVAGLTGVLLPWYDELDSALARKLYSAPPPHQGAAVLDPAILRQKVITAHPGAVINFMPLSVEPGLSVSLSLARVDPKTGKSSDWSANWDQLFVDPYTGRTLGVRKWGDILEGRVNVMPFLYRLHYSLALGDIGRLAFGIAALIWTLDCFVGFYLTFPVRLKAREAAATRVTSWWTRWAAAWRVRWVSSAYKINVDLHRAGGLWIWPMLLVFAWSSVAFNLPRVYRPVMGLFGADDIAERFVPLPRPRLAPAIDFPTAITHARVLAGRELAERGLSAKPGRETIRHVTAMGVYLYRFSSSADFTSKGGWNQLAFDSDTGALRAIELPTGQNGANSFTNWIMALHMGMVFGLPYRIFVSCMGGFVTILSVTGIIIFMKKRSARLASSARSVRCRTATA